MAWDSSDQPPPRRRTTLDAVGCAGCWHARISSTSTSAHTSGLLLPSVADPPGSRRTSRRAGASSLTALGSANMTSRSCSAGMVTAVALAPDHRRCRPNWPGLRRQPQSRACERATVRAHRCAPGAGAGRSHPVTRDTTCATSCIRSGRSVRQGAQIMVLTNAAGGLRRLTAGADQRSPEPDRTFATGWRGSCRPDRRLLTATAGTRPANPTRSFRRRRLR